MHAVTGSQQNPQLHKVLPYVDFSSIGVIGHSEGGAYTMESATKATQFPIKAGVFSHGGSSNAAPSIPSNLPVFFVSGTADPRRRRLYWAYQATTSVPRIFATIEGGKHMYPAHGSPMNEMMAHFLACYLLPRKDSCEIIFGDGSDSLCKKNPMGDCQIIKETDYVEFSDPVPSPVWDEPGEFGVAQDYYTLPGFDCGDGTVGDGGILIYFPAHPDTRPGMTYPVASFLHGSGGGRFDGLCRGIASFGIVVVAVTRGTCGEWSVQQMHAVTGSQQNPQLHKVLPYVDFSSIGVIGHSEGGAYTMESATKATQFPIKAGVFSHGGSSNAAPSIPSNLPVFFVSGTADPRRRRLYWAYQATTSVPRIFATIEGGKHMYPAHGSPMNEMMAHFLACYLLPRKESCEIIYGDGSDSLCKKNQMGDCQIIKETNNYAEFSDPVPAPVWDEPGEFEVAQDYYTLPGFDCGDGTVGDGGILIYFPANPDNRPGMTYPVASFLHGSGGGRFDGLCRGIASFGIVVVAVTQGTCGEWSVQQMHAVTGSQQNSQLHMVLPYVDFSSIGVIGHSEGGAYTMESATKANQFPIKAGVFSHGGSSNAAPDIPSNLPVFFVSGTADPRRRRLYWAYQATTSVPRIFATIEGGKHMYPAHGSPMNEMMAHFLACYLLPREESCEIIYGDGLDSLCKKNPMGDCQIIKDSNSDSNTIVEKYNKEYIRM